MINLLKHCALTYFAKNLRWEDTPTRVFSDDNKVSINKVRGYDVTLVLNNGAEDRHLNLVSNKSNPNELIRSEVWRRSEDIEYIYVSSLNSAQIGVTYNLNGSRYAADNCSVLKLIQMVLLKKFGLMYLLILYRKSADRITTRKVSRRLRKVNELTKFELFECMILCESRAGAGTVRVEDLIAVLSGETSTVGWADIYGDYRSKVTSLLDNYVNEGEVYGGNDHYKLTGKGMSRFAEEKEKARLNRMQSQILRAQRGMLWVTIALAVGTIASVAGGFKCELSAAEWVKSIAPKAVELVAKQCKP